VCGGSHGGFLSGHLMGQHPQRFKCAGLRNPVLNIALMVGVTDIPDWCFIETYGTQVRGQCERFQGAGGGWGGKAWWACSWLGVGCCKDGLQGAAAGLVHSQVKFTSLRSVLGWCACT
jgi:hypothetical protein